MILELQDELEEKVRLIEEMSLSFKQRHEATKMLDERRALFFKVLYLLLPSYTMSSSYSDRNLGVWKFPLMCLVLAMYLKIHS